MRDPIQDALSLLSSMVNCGEEHSDISRAAIQAARKKVDAMHQATLAWSAKIGDLEMDRDRWSALHGKVAGELVTLRERAEKAEAEVVRLKASKFL